VSGALSADIAPRFVRSHAYYLRASRAPTWRVWDSLGDLGKRALFGILAFFRKS